MLSLLKYKDIKPKVIQFIKIRFAILKGKSNFNRIYFKKSKIEYHKLF